MTPHDVAIVGMACVFPKAPDLATYWRNIRDGVDCITDVPAARWDPLYYDPKSTAPDRFYARRGGFIDDYATFDPAAFGVMPIAAKGAEPEQFLALQTAVAALSDAGYAERAFPRGRTNVILGRGNYLGPAMLRLVNVTRGAEQLLANLRQLVPALGAAELDAIKREFQKACGTYGPDTAIGLVPNLVASRIANRLDLGGAAYTIDAACASTLIAVDQACRQLGSGLADMALCGGVHLCQDPAFWSVFTQLGALSRSEQIRPFDEHADGLLIGEGLGMVVLKRLADARADGDRIYAVIRGSGTASDGRDVSLMTPRVDGQVLALTRAWQDAGIDPSRLGLLEAHGTGTPAGDAAEIETLARVFGPARSEEERIPIGSVKSMIGHTMPAAGAAGLIKTALAVYHGVRPPTLHCDAPNGALRNTRFRIATRAEPWDVALRCAAVNAFGFGGINAHVILESEDVRTAPVARGRSRAVPDAEHALLIAAPSQDALLEALAAGSSGGSGEWRAAILDPTPKRLAAARAAIASGRPRHGRDGIYFSPRGLLTQGGKIAFVFPGVEAAFAPRIDDIATHFNLPLPDLRASDLAYQGVSVGRLNMFMYRVMSELGCRPHAVAGHSIGEWCGMLACGMFGAVSVEQVLGVLKPGSLRIAEVTYIAAGAGAARLESIVRELPDVAISHDNCIHQSIVCAPEAQVEPLLERLRRERILYEVLPFRSGFHSSALAKHVDSFADNLARLPLHVANLPLWSATTCTPYPDAPADIAALFLRHLVEPVRFRELILAMYDDGVRVFVQLGTGSTMSFVDDVLLNRPHHAIPLVVAQRPGMDQLRRAGAALFVEGASLDLARIGLMKPGAAPREAHPMKLELGVPLIRLEHAPLIQPTSSPALRPESSRTLATTAHNAVLDQFDASLREIADAQQAVAQALAKLDKAPPATTRADERVDRLVLSVDTFPELIDHALIPQPNDWPDLADRAPAVPMTMSIALMREAAQRLDPQRVAVRVENVQANTWLYTEPALEVDMRAKRVDADRIAVNIGKFIECVVTMADRYAAPPPPISEPLRDVRNYPVSDDVIYTEGWMFHGPLYRGITSIDAYAANGMRAQLRALPAKGALLDAAGQLVGLWMTHIDEESQLAMPIKVERIDYYAPDPTPGTRVDATLWMRGVSRWDGRADLDLCLDGRLYARVAGWTDWRFPTGGGIFGVMRQPQHNLLAVAQPEGFMLLHDPGWSSATYEFLCRRYTTAREIDAMGGVKQMQRKGEWLQGRIAAKDAVRKLLFDLGHGPMYPVEVAVIADENGKPLVRGRFERDIRVSIAHKRGIAVAIAAESIDPGIDVEKIEPRGDRFAALAFGAEELALMPEGSRDEWLTRLWCAKEAAGKALGRGLSGNPKSLRITKVEGDRLMVEGRWVATRRWRDHIVAWTVQ